MMDREFALKLVKGTVKLEARLRRIRGLKLDPPEKYQDSKYMDDKVSLEDLRACFTWNTIKCPKSQAAKYADILEEMEKYCRRQKDGFHSGFFFTLRQLMRHQHGLMKLPEDIADYELADSSINRTLRRLRIQPPLDK